MSEKTKRADKDTMTFIYSQSVKFNKTVDKEMDECQVLIKKLNSTEFREALAGGDGDIALQSLEAVLQNFESTAGTVKKLAKLADNKLSRYAELNSDKAGFTQSRDSLKRNADTTSSLRR